MSENVREMVLVPIMVTTRQSGASDSRQQAAFLPLTPEGEPVERDGKMVAVAQFRLEMN